MTFADAKQRFSNRVADYVRYRPGYPPEVLAVLRTACGLRPGHVIADIGSGTGFLSELFLKNGNRVYGIEPNEAMRQAGEEYLASHDGFVSLNGSAEATTLEDSSIDFVAVGQAFHWFEPDARQMDTPFASAYEELLVKYGTDYTRVREAYPDAPAMHDFFGAGDFTQHSLPNSQILDWDSLVGRLRSSSFAPPEGHPNYAPMMVELQELFRANQEDGRVRMDFATHAYFGRLAKQE
jgi:SAM-dependent methyltransferase